MSVLGWVDSGSLDRSDLALRLALAPRIAHSNRLGGAWWPESTDLVEELAPLLRVASFRLGRIRGVLLNRDEWAPTPLDWTPTGNRSVRIGWYGVQDAHVAVLMGDNAKRVPLLVVPPETDEASATAAMSLASTMSNALSAVETLQAAAQAAAPRAAGY